MWTAPSHRTSYSKSTATRASLGHGKQSVELSTSPHAPVRSLANLYAYVPSVYDPAGKDTNASSYTSREMTRPTALYSLSIQLPSSARLARITGRLYHLFQHCRG